MREELQALRKEFRETTAMARSILELKGLPSEGRIESAAGRLSSSYLSILLVGGTQVGKSSLLNALAGRAVSETGKGAATTQNAVFYTPDDIYESDLPFRTGEDARVVHGADKLLGKVVIDAPDCDSFMVQNRVRSMELLTTADVVLVVTSWEKYNQLSLHELIRPEIQGRSSSSMVFAMNKMEELSESEQDEVLADFQQVLGKAGIPGATIFKISALRAFEERTGKEPASAWLTRLEQLEDFLDARLDKKIKESNLAREMSTGLVTVMEGGADGPIAAALAKFLDSAESAEIEFRASLREAVEEVLENHRGSFVSTMRGIVGERMSGAFGTYLSALTYLRPGKLTSLLPSLGGRSAEDVLLDGVAGSLARRLSNRLIDGMNSYLRRVRAGAKELRERVPLSDATRAALEAVGAEPMLSPEALTAKVRPRLDVLTQVPVHKWVAKLFNMPMLILIHIAPFLLIYQFLTNVDPARVTMWVLTLPFVLLSLLEIERFVYEGVVLQRLVAKRIKELSSALEESVVEAVGEGALASPRRAQIGIRTLLDRHRSLSTRIEEIQSAAGVPQIEA